MRDRVRFSATYFYTRIVTITAFDSVNAVIRRDTDPFGRVSGYINGSGGISRGLELSIESRPTQSLTVSGSYTYTRANDDRDLQVRGFFRAFNVPRHTFSLVATQRIGRRLSVTTDITGNNELFNQFLATGRAYRVPGFVKTDVSASYMLSQTDQGSLNLYTRIGNIFNRTYYDAGWLAPKATAVAGLSYKF